MQRFYAAPPNVVPVGQKNYTNFEGQLHQLRIVFVRDRSRICRRRIVLARDRGVTTPTSHHFCTRSGGNYTNFASFLYEIEAEYADEASFLYEIGAEYADDAAFLYEIGAEYADDAAFLYEERAEHAGLV
jgi:hypothetical protein